MDDRSGEPRPASPETSRTSGDTFSPRYTGERRAPSVPRKEFVGRATPSLLGTPGHMGTVASPETSRTPGDTFPPRYAGANGHRRFRGRKSSAGQHLLSWVRPGANGRRRFRGRKSSAGQHLLSSVRGSPGGGGGSTSVVPKAVTTRSAGFTRVRRAAGLAVRARAVPGAGVGRHPVTRRWSGAATPATG
jgi:hypothetical protein